MKEACLEDFLVEFDMTIEYKLGRLVVVLVDGLNRKAQLASIKEQRNHVE